MKQGLFRRQKGQGLVEYALIIVLIAIVVLVALRVMGPTVRRIFTRIALELEHPGMFNGPIVSVSSISVSASGSCLGGTCSNVLATATVSLIDDEGHPISAEAHVQFINSASGTSYGGSGTGTIGPVNVGGGAQGSSVQACVIAVTGHTFLGSACASDTY